MKNKNDPRLKPRLQPSKETNVTGVKRNLLAESEIVKTEKEIDAVLAENTQLKTTSKTTGSLPVGYDPNLPLGKQREFIGLV